MPDSGESSAEALEASRSHVYQVRAGYGDTDQGGVVHHAVYLRWLEQARVEWLRARGLDFGELERRHRVTLVVANAELSYRRPARFDDVLQIRATLMRKLGATLVFEYAIHCRGELLATAKTRLACVQLDSLRPVRMPFADALG
ncbi:MAG: acyl-CoA thioesterase [Deltaproteobacteria bacterium]|nr:acyl-CoA thioesterase [Deltaproteobacteria bacterium]